MSDFLFYTFICFILVFFGFCFGFSRGDKYGYDNCKNEIESSGYVLHYHTVNSTNWVEVIKK